VRGLSARKVSDKIKADPYTLTVNIGPNRHDCGNVLLHRVPDKM